jgi:hypothetical protein
MRNQLLRRPAATIGAIFSRSGFTAPAFTLAQYLAPQTILLWEGEELEFALGHEAMCRYLIDKYRYSVEEGMRHYNIVSEVIP